MKMKTGLLALGAFTIAGALTVSCGGSSDSTDNSSGAGTSSTSAGTTSTAGSSSSSAGNSSSSGGTSSSSGGNGTTTGGTASTNGGNVATGGNNNPGAGGDAAGGAGNPPGCPATQPMNGGTCMRMAGFNICSYGTMDCTCRGRQMSTWQCIDTSQIGAGGAGAFPEATCPANAKVGDACTGGPGACTGQNCVCGQNEKIAFCF